MKRNTYIFILGALFLFSGLFGASAQTSTERVRNKLLLPSSSGTRVIVNEDGDAGAIIKSLEATQRPVTKVNGYRVQIFFDNGQYARSEANAIIAAFKEIYPDTPTYTSYNTSYKVSVGNCLNKTEAIMLWGKVKSNFDKAFIIKEEVPIDLIIETPKKTTATTF